jgi:Protein of unknown function (DUF1064)
MIVRKVRSKYGSKKVQIDGVTFDSRAEAKRYQDLLVLERAGIITELRLQPKFELAPSIKYTSSSRATPPLRYFADFAYVDQHGRRVVEDVKGGPVTEGFRIKKHLMMALHGIEVVEVRVR